MGQPAFCLPRKQQPDQEQAHTREHSHNEESGDKRNIEGNDAADDGGEIDAGAFVQDEQHDAEGGRKEADHQVEHHDEPEVDGVDAQLLDNRHKDGGQQGEGGDRLEEAADNQQDHVDDHQDHQRIPADPQQLFRRG